MVITTSDSNETLISLNNLNRKANGLQRTNSLEFLRASPTTQSYDFAPTFLYLPEYDDDDFMDDDESFYSCSSADDMMALLSKPANNTRDCLYLPCTEELSVDECLKCLPCVMDTCEDLLIQTPAQHFSADPPQSTRIIYVAQQEMAHAVPLQCDVLMSDKATTCHILAVRSQSARGVVPLVSLAHIDGTRYDACIRAMIQRHLHHHQMDDSLIRNDSEEKKDLGNGESNDDLLEVDFHIMGGFDDRDGTSRGITNWLFRLLAEIAHEQRDRILFTLRTCAVSSMNDTGHGAPVGRGMGIHLRTGQVFLATCDATMTGPDAVLRSVRLWCPDDEEDAHLEVIHEETLNMIKVTPFYFAPSPELKALLKLPNHELIKYTSTSPECEDDEFCLRLRHTFAYLRDVRAEDIFGPELNRTRYFKRIAGNTWRGLHAFE